LFSTPTSETETEPKSAGIIKLDWLDDSKADGLRCSLAGVTIKFKKQSLFKFYTYIMNIMNLMNTMNIMNKILFNENLTYIKGHGKYVG
jgi:hypothetical protein